MSMIQRLPMSMITVLPDVIPNNDPQVQSSKIPADDTVKIEQADENREPPVVKYMREIGYWSPPKYPSFKKRKTTKKKRQSKNQQPKKRKTDITFKEIPSVVNEQGEHSEVQVFEEFNTDEILANLYKHHNHNDVLAVLYPCHMAASRTLMEVIGTNTTAVHQPSGQPRAT